MTVIKTAPKRVESNSFFVLISGSYWYRRFHISGKYNEQCQKWSAHNCPPYKHCEASFRLNSISPIQDHVFAIIERVNTMASSHCTKKGDKQKLGTLSHYQYLFSQGSD